MNGEDIAEIRKYLDETLTEFGKRFSVTHTAVRMWENGVNHPNTIHSFQLRLLKRKLRRYKNQGLPTRERCAWAIYWKYFIFLDKEDVKQIIDLILFAVPPIEGEREKTNCEIMRIVQRALYRQAKKLGWKHKDGKWIKQEIPRERF